MEQDFPEVEERFAADAWREAVYVDHRITHDDLDDLVAQFLGAGNQITQVATGAQNATTSEYNGRIVSTSVSGLTAAENQRAKAALNRSRHAEHDAQIVSRLQAMLPTTLKRNEMAKALQISDHTMQRILANYFGRDERVNHLRKIERGFGSNKVKTIHDAEWLLSHGRIAEVRGVKFKRCCRCKTDKTVDEYYSDNARSSGISSSCRECDKASNAEFREKQRQIKAV